MIAFRQVDARYPFLWEGTGQPAGRWHADGEGPAHYFADTPDGAWAEFLRHEEIIDQADLATIRRQLWAVELGDAPVAVARVPDAALAGGPETYARCQREARRLRASGVQRLIAKSAALARGGAHGFIVDNGVQMAAPREGMVVVVFGAPSGLIGWVAGDAARPGVDLLDRVRHYASR
jgi:hypothetical protein